jgi:hypothetical protein
MAMDPTLYTVKLGPWAAERGERVICQVLAWTGHNDAYARVRVVDSTLKGYWGGKVGIARRDRLVPLRRTPPAA